MRIKNIQRWTLQVCLGAIVALFLCSGIAWAQPTTTRNNAFQTSRLFQDLYRACVEGLEPEQIPACVERGQCPPNRALRAWCAAPPVAITTLVGVANVGEAQLASGVTRDQLVTAGAIAIANLGALDAHCQVRITTDAGVSDGDASADDAGTRLVDHVVQLDQRRMISTPHNPLAWFPGSCEGGKTIQIRTGVGLSCPPGQHIVRPTARLHTAQDRLTSATNPSDLGRVLTELEDHGVFNDSRAERASAEELNTTTIALITVVKTWNQRVKTFVANREAQIRSDNHVNEEWNARRERTQAHEIEMLIEHLKLFGISVLSLAILGWIVSFTIRRRKAKKATAPITTPPPNANKPDKGHRSSVNPPAPDPLPAALPPDTEAVEISLIDRAIAFCQKIVFTAKGSAPAANAMLEAWLTAAERAYPVLIKAAKAEGVTEGKASAPTAAQIDETRATARKVGFDSRNSEVEGLKAANLDASRMIATQATEFMAFLQVLKGFARNKALKLIRERLGEKKITAPHAAFVVPAPEVSVTEDAPDVSVVAAAESAIDEQPAALPAQAPRPETRKMGAIYTEGAQDASDPDRVGSDTDAADVVNAVAAVEIPTIEAPAASVVPPTRRNDAPTFHAAVKVAVADEGPTDVTSRDDLRPSTPTWTGLAPVADAKVFPPSDVAPVAQTADTTVTDGTREAPPVTPPQQSFSPFGPHYVAPARKASGSDPAIPAVDPPGDGNHGSGPRLSRPTDPANQAVDEDRVETTAMPVAGKSA